MPIANLENVAWQNQLKLKWTYQEAKLALADVEFADREGTWGITPQWVNDLNRSYPVGNYCPYGLVIVLARKRIIAAFAKRIEELENG